MNHNFSRTIIFDSSCQRKKNQRTVTPIENERVPAPSISARSSENKVTVGRFCKLDYGEEERARAKQRSRQRDLSRGSAGWTLETHPQTFANCPTRKEISKREISYERERER